MIQFKSREDLQLLDNADPAYPIVADLIQRLITNYEAEGYVYDPQADGWICLVEPVDIDRPITEIWDDGTRLADLWWEGITYEEEHGHFIGVYLKDNQWGLAVVIPNQPWVNGELRQVIEENLDPPIDRQTEGVR